MKVLIDNGHGSNTPGKRSPDGRLREYAYTREIASRLEMELRKNGIDAERIVKRDAVGRTSIRLLRLYLFLSTAMLPVMRVIGCLPVVGRHGLRSAKRKRINWLHACMRMPNTVCRE